MKQVTQWFVEQGWQPQAFQKECWKAYTQGLNGILHAPTGSGKTYALWGGIIQEAFHVKKHPFMWSSRKTARAFFTNS